MLEYQVEQGDLREGGGTLRMKMTIDRKMANPCRERRLFHTVLFSSYAIQEAGTKMKKMTSMTCRRISRPKICVRAGLR